MVTQGGTLKSRAVAAASAERRIVDAALVCVARFGVTKTTLEDVAGEAGCSRATVYRYFPGKQHLLAAVVRFEVGRIGGVITEAMAAEATLENAVVAGMVTAAEQFAGHEALQFVLAYEPEVVLPHLSFSHADALLAVASNLIAPQLARFLPADRVLRAGEWLCRIAMSYSCNPSGALPLTDAHAVRGLVREFVLPGLDPKG
jgi:AcrR family transcriptional regulator